MRTVSRLAVAAALAVTIVASAPPAAADPVTSGERINLLIGTPTTFPAGTPFHIAHGWCFTPDQPGRLRLATRDDTRFELRVNGLRIDGATELERGRSAGGCLALKTDHFDFPEGLPTGIHQFDGRWYLAGTLEHEISVSILFGDVTLSRISLLDPPERFPAGEPFYVRHGFCFLEDAPPEEVHHPDTRFDLYLNGVLVDSTIELRDGDDATPGCVVEKHSISTFPAGLTAGDHSFEGHWLVAGDLQLDLIVTITFE
jgi:hypothetical protein